MLANGDHKVFHCRWNWCARTFQFPTDLLGHLKSEHFSHILRVEKKELDIYLRSNEGRSGMTGMKDIFSEWTSERAPVNRRQLAPGYSNPVNRDFARVTS